MSITISESTQSIHDAASIHEYQNEQWDRESEVLPRASRLYGKASSTLLGQRVGDDGTTSSISSRLRNEDSSSTLKSYYDRQKSPLSISQQTSASSARDLALRKGFPPVIQRSPLLQVESALDPFDAQFSAKDEDVSRTDAELSEKSSRKKPTRLDLSMLFPRSKRNSTLAPSPSSISTNASRDTTNFDSGRRRLKKTPSKESVQSQHSIHSTRSHEPYRRPTYGGSNSVYDHYENMPVRSPHMDRIPESRALDSTSSRGQPGVNGASNQAQKRDSYLASAEQQPFSWKNVRASMISPPWESSSAASISSRNTKTSRHTNGSMLSNSDLQEKSVLSLSSDSEGEDSDHELAQSPHPVQQDNHQQSERVRGSRRPDYDNRYQSLQQPGGLTTRGQSKKSSSNKETAFLEVPSRSHPRMSPAWTPAEKEKMSTPVPPIDQRRSSNKEKRVSQTSSSLKSQISSLQPTPPLSPSSVEFRQTSDRSSRFMAVTKQEEALLEALRQKRARMREKIIEEHEIAKSPSPPRIPERAASRAATDSRQLTDSSTNTLRGASNGKKNGSSKVLLYLNTPAAEAQFIDAAEPSPDLSDFLSYGSDEGTTPRASWQPPKSSRPRPDSYISPQHKFDHYSQKAPPSAARLSAVGVAPYRNDIHPSQALVSKKRSTGVKFLDHESRLVNTQDFLLDENDSEVLWRS